MKWLFPKGEDALGALFGAQFGDPANPRSRKAPLATSKLPLAADLRLSNNC